MFAFFGIDPKAETKEARMKKLVDYLEKPVDFEDTFDLGDEKVLKAKKPKKSSSSAPKAPKRAKSA